LIKDNPIIPIGNQLGFGREMVDDDFVECEKLTGIYFA